MLFADVRDYGAIGDGVTDDTVAIQAAIDSDAPARLVGGATYLITNTLLVSPDHSLEIPSGTTVLANLSGAVAAIEITGGGVAGGDLSGYGTILSARAAWNLSTKQIGVLLSGNCGRLSCFLIQGFEIGVGLIGTGGGSVYNSVNVQRIYECHHSVEHNAYSGGWTNGNAVEVMQCWLSSLRWANEPANCATSVGLFIDSNTTNAPNTNRFIGGIEGLKLGVSVSGYYNRFHIRDELHTPVTFKVTVNATTSGITPAYNRWYDSGSYVPDAQIGGAYNTDAIALIRTNVRGQRQ